MPVRAPTDSAIAPRQSILLLLTLITAGLAGNYFRFPIFLNIDFLFGSIFAMLALQLFGFGRGILTANAFKEDRDNCLTVGMDDYLAKLIDIADLPAMLGKWTSFSASSKGDAVSAQVSETGSPTPLR